MALSSMTGFARRHGVAGSYAWSWEIKSVNAKGLDLRLRLPPGWDAVETPVRSSAAQVLARGSVYGTLTGEETTLLAALRDSPLAAGVERLPAQLLEPFELARGRLVSLSHRCGA